MPKLVAGAVDEVVAVEENVEEAAFALSSLARQRQGVVQVELLAYSGPRIVSSVALDEGSVGAAGVTQELGLGKAHLAAHTDLGAEAGG